MLSGYLRLNLVASHWQTRSWTLSRARIRREIYFPEKNNLFVFATTEATWMLALEIGNVNLSFSVCGVRVRRYKDSLLYVSLHSTEGDREVTVTRLLQASTKLSNMSCTWKYCFMCIWTLNLIWELSIQNSGVKPFLLSACMVRVEEPLFLFVLLIIFALNVNAPVFIKQLCLQTLVPACHGGHDGCHGGWGAPDTEPAQHHSLRSAERRAEKS